ncbi:XisI protein [Crocosphaera watsonii]|uniref:FdxN element excision controlling factor protein n=1 Tax=Crocosphaera watsonii WH 0401 TaxID=555881 RepID=T2JE87_CROWT|nr:XisI protein [Crocosphaera watsonii]CCQ63560.1 fdxN element excision controlling factor protein [Crocosphaera watsonii WH 0401]
MDKLEKYSFIIQNILQEYAQFSQDKDVETELIFDPIRHHYQIVNVGWKNDNWIYGCILHLDIKNNKIWIQHNGTEIEIGEELVKNGVPESDIVIGFHPPFKRQFTEYSVN